eukprot:scaffold3337_cov169-Amphora_coffeaeformis.AAC.1
MSGKVFNEPLQGFEAFVQDPSTIVTLVNIGRTIGTSHSSKTILPPSYINNETSTEDVSRNRIGMAWHGIVTLLDAVKEKSKRTKPLRYCRPIQEAERFQLWGRKSSSRCEYMYHSSVSFLTSVGKKA